MSRPDPVVLSGPWSRPRLEQHLAAARIPLRLAFTSRAGFPLVASLWFVHEGDALWCATQAGASVARALARDPRCGFEIAGERPPYRGARGWGRAEIVPERGAELLGTLIRRYLDERDAQLGTWLLGRAEREVAIRIVPRRWISWDYSERMADER